jgi:hypothetical protein
MCITRWVKGAVILARSGMGKTSLCSRFAERGLQRHGLGVSSRVAVEISLPEVEASCADVKTFAFNRIAAHETALTTTIFSSMLTESGIDLVCDAFDRLPEAAQIAAQTQLSLLLRDFPKCRVFVFSRTNVAPKIDLPRFYVRSLSYDEKLALLDATSSRPETFAALGAPSLPSAMPEFLQRISGIPLILNWVISFAEANNTLPRDLVELFDFWLAAILHGQEQRPTAYSELVEALSIISDATWDAPAAVAELAKKLTQAGLSPSRLDELVVLDAVTSTGLKVEVTHQALADFLRARARVHRADTDGLYDFSRLRLDRDAFFPVLLIAMTHDRVRQQQLLSQLSKLGLVGYLDAVRYRGRIVSMPVGLSHEEVTEHVMSEIADGFNGPARLFFPELLPDLIRAVDASAKVTSELIATGKVGMTFTDVSFSLHERGTDGGDYASIYFRQHLDLPHQARLYGLELFGEALQKIVSECALKGGPVWHEERFLSRMRLARRTGVRVSPSLQVEEQLEFWQNYVEAGDDESAVQDGVASMAQHFIFDLEILKVARVEAMTVWWNLGGSEEWWSRDWDQQNSSLGQYYIRTDRAYQEVVASTFGAIADDLGTYSLLPRSWNLIYSQANMRSGNPWVKGLWIPVADQHDVAADVSEYQEGDDVDWFSTTSQQLARLGRSTKHVSYSSGLVRGFSGTSAKGKYDGKTVVLRAVCERIQSELEKHFKGVLGG